MKKLKSLSLMVFLSFLIQFTVHSQSAKPPDYTVDQILLPSISPPWGLNFISSTEIIFTEKSGKLWRYNMVSNVNTEVTGLPSINQNGQGGLLDVAMHPNFTTNGFVYLSYAVAATGGQTTALGRGKLVDNKLENFTEIFRALPIVINGSHFGSRIVFDNDNFVYVSVGDRGTPSYAQNINNHAGKVMRLKDDGAVPADNPLVGTANARPEIFSWGHRNIQGMALNTSNGKVYAHEHGPRGGDELNVLKKGANYGWPTISFGINYDGSIVTTDTARDGMEQPLTYWIPSIAPCGLTFIQGAQGPNEFEVLIGALAGTHIHWLKMKNDKVVQSARNLQGYARFRDVKQAPDGRIYALTETPNRLIRLKSNIITAAENTVETAENLNSYIFPNPSADGGTLYFSLATNEKITLRMISMNGLINVVLQDQQYTAGNHNIVLPNQNLQKGIYQIELTKGGKKTLLKWVVI